MNSGMQNKVSVRRELLLAIITRYLITSNIFDTSNSLTIAWQNSIAFFGLRAGLICFDSRQMGGAAAQNV